MESERGGLRGDVKPQGLVVFRTYQYLFAPIAYDISLQAGIAFAAVVGQAAFEAQEWDALLFFPVIFAEGRMVEQFA